MFKTSVQTKDVGHGRNLGMKIVMVAAMESLNRILMRTAKRRATFAKQSYADDDKTSAIGIENLMT